MPTKSKIPDTIRRMVAQRAGHCCEYCLISDKHSSGSFSIDHIIPLKLLGVTELVNLAYSCTGCNGHKHAKTHSKDPETGKKTPLFNPRGNDWKLHFKWTEDFTVIVGLTPIGRATVAALKLNREPLVNLRKVLRFSGVLPPAYSR